MDFLKDMAFVAFVVKINADFCCCKNGKYHFEEISITNSTQGDANYLMGVRGYTYFERLLRELPSIFARTVDEVITLGLNCCKD